MEAKTWYTVNLGQLIRQKRTLMGFTKDDLAYRTGIDSKHIGKLERGQKLAGSFTLGRIQVVLNLDLEKFFSEFEAKFFNNKIYTPED